jgi:hypothetical protein
MKPDAVAAPGAFGLFAPLWIGTEAVRIALQPLKAPDQPGQIAVVVLHGTAPRRVFSTIE